MKLQWPHPLLCWE